MAIKLTQYSHGAGCGCKIAPEILSKIVEASSGTMQFNSLLVGNQTKDDAAVVAIDDHRAVVSTTDFFMPIVDDPFDFGRIAATNAISDIYAMGATPICAIAILGWPIDKLDVAHAAKVIEGGRVQCERAGIPLAGGHSIDAPEPIFGLAVTGLVDRAYVATNAGCRPGDRLLLTKPLGIGVITTAQKRGLVAEAHINEAVAQMTTLNRFGQIAGGVAGVHAITDVTGFGLMGHALELAQGGRVSIAIDSEQVPLLEGVDEYIRQGAVPGGSQRNYQSFVDHLDPLTDLQIARYFDPQTSGGLLISVDDTGYTLLAELAQKQGQPLYEIGRVLPYNGRYITLK